MDTFNKVMGVTITIFISIFIFFFGVKTKLEDTPKNLYQVYLNGESIGFLENKDEFLNLVDKEQTEIKEKYKVDKVYPPSGLDIQDVTTDETDVSTAVDVYNKVKNKHKKCIIDLPIYKCYDVLCEIL